MSLRPDDRSSRARSRSRDGRDHRDGRDRSRSNVRSAPKAPSPPSAAKYASPMPGSFNGSSNPTYEVRAPSTLAHDRDRNGYSVPYPLDGHSIPMDNHADYPPYDRPPYGANQRARFPSIPDIDDDDDLAYGLDTHSRQQPSRHASYSSGYPAQPYPDSRNDKYVPQPDAPQPYHYEYAQVPDKATYTVKPQTGSRPAQYPSDPYSRDHRDRDERDRNLRDRDSRDRDPRDRSYRNDYREDGAQIVEMIPQGEKKKSSQRLSVGGLPSALKAPTSFGMLGVGGARNGSHAVGGGMPPASPLLEAYRGTYQSVSPMALAIRPKDDSDLSDLDLDGPPTLSLGGKNDKLAKEAAKGKGKDKGGKEKRRVVVYDAEEDAKKIAAALKHTKIDPDGLIDTLPGLSHDNIIDLRKEYKKQVKIQGKGINLPKHLNLKVSGNFGKAAYVTSLGRWESEGYWANFWYQSHGSRRELLIESLMGRTNTEIRFIKDEFKDKRYGDSLTRCMEKELKMDKFRSAVLMVLEERRQEEQDVYPLEYKNRDVEVLHQSLTSRQGGESAMLEVIVRRSDAHLRDVLSGYQNVYGENFARSALKRSNNLVGEVIAHILNGVINKPARDAILINHAIKDIADHNKEEELRYELLISRLVRIHWDKLHLQRVKKEYAAKFRRELQQDIETSVKGDFREFMCELCEIKTP